MARSSFKRTARISSLLREVIARVISTEVKDPRLRQVTVTDVEVTGDLREAKVFVSHPLDSLTETELLAGLQSAAGFIRRVVGEQVRLRVTPTLLFRMDHSLAYGARIEKVLRDLKTTEDDTGEQRDEEG